MITMLFMKISLSLFLWLSLFPFCLTAQNISLVTDKPGGVYDAAGGAEQKICFILERKDKSILAPDEQILCKLDINNRKDLQIAVFQAGQWNQKTRHQVTVPVTENGWYLLHVYKRYTDKQGRVQQKKLKVRGALAGVEQIKTAVPYPRDFDRFWAQQISAMSKVPMNPVLEKLKIADLSLKDKVRAWRFKLDCGNGNHAYGTLAMPLKAEPKSLPVIVQYHGAGTIGIAVPGLYYAENSIHIVMSPHMTECGRDAAYYAQAQKELTAYPYRHVSDREKYYMKDMILRAVRTLEFARSLPEWDGRNLLTHGESQGGFQALAAAALDHHVSFCLSMVPAMTEHCGSLQGRKDGWPQILNKIRSEKTLSEAGRESHTALYRQVLDTVPYFDCVNFARKIRCEIWISTGLQDEVCPPTGIAALYNNIPDGVDKHLFINPHAGHDAGNRDVVPRLHSIVIP